MTIFGISFYNKQLVFSDKKSVVGFNSGTLGKNIRGLSSSGSITIDTSGGTAPSTYKNCK